MINEIYKLFLDELRFIEQHSDFSIQEMKNISGCGGLVEIAIRKFFKEIIGERFKITHGHIYSTLKKKLSPQIDIIVTDKLVCHSLKKFEYLDNLEIVPAEAVVGIFEIKRTLGKHQIIEAGAHLKEIMEFVPVSKDFPSRYLPGGIQLKGGTGITIDGGKYSNPIIGIIGLFHENLDDFNEKNIPWFIDVLFCFDGFLKALKDPDKDSLKIFSFRKESNEYSYKTIEKPLNDEQILKIFVAYLISYLNEVSGRIFDINDYFF